MIDELAAIQPAFEPSDLQAVMSATGVDGTVLVQTVADVDETREFLATAAEHAFIRGVVGWVDLTDPGVSDVLADLRSGQGGSKLVAIRHQVHDEPDADWLSRADVRRGLRLVADAGLVYDLLVRTRELPSAIQLVRDMSDVRFVLDHLAKPPFVSGDLTEWSARFRELAGADNVVAKVSGLVTEADWHAWSVGTLQPAVDVALEAFGPERLMFGSDWPVCLLATTYSQWVSTAQSLTSTLSESERARVFEANAVAAYGL
jgi:L-fuconolactonase